MIRLFYSLLLLILSSLTIQGQESIPIIEDIKLESIAPNTIKHYWLKMIDNGMAQPVCIPIIIARGQSISPVLGLAAAIHGNELNGIRVIQRVMEDIDIAQLKGCIIAVPGLNGISLPLHRRRYIDEEDLNRHFPGKEKGNRSQQYAWEINQKFLSKIDYLVDMHTASFGRENSLYVRADMEDDQMAQMARLQHCDIILKNKGTPSANQQRSATRTMRAEAVSQGIPAITVEYGNPQVYQADMIERGKIGIENIMSWLELSNQPIKPAPTPTLCKKSYWVYLEEGGYLELKVALNQRVSKGEVIGELRTPFGNLIKQYLCPEDGIVIGRSSNPVNMDGGRIIHLGIID